MLGSKLVKFLMSILRRQVNSSSNFASFLIVMTHNSSIKLKLSTLDEKMPLKSQFWGFPKLWWKCVKLLMSFSKPQVSFSSNFASLYSITYSVMKDNSCLLFSLKHYILCSKGVLWSAPFWGLWVLGENSSNSL